MKKELISAFSRECGHAKELLESGVEEHEEIFQYVSNADMETTLRTIRSIYMMVKKQSL